VNVLNAERRGQVISALVEGNSICSADEVTKPGIFLKKAPVNPGTKL
jgi:hypothetical protein